MVTESLNIAEYTDKQRKPDQTFISLHKNIWVSYKATLYMYNVWPFNPPRNPNII